MSEFTKKIFDQIGLIYEASYYNCTILVDGQTIMKYLLNLDANPSLAFSGGIYEIFKERILLFFRKLQDCKIRTVVVLNGATTDFRYKKRIDSFRYFISTCKDPYVNRYSIWHHLALEVFIYTLQNLDISYVKLIQAPYDGDDILAFLSYRFQLPVLTDNCDFFFHRHKVLLLDEYELYSDNTDKVIFLTLDPLDVQKQIDITNELHYQMAPLILSNYNIPMHFPDRIYFTDRTIKMFLDEKLRWISLTNSDSLNGLKIEIMNRIGKKYHEEIDYFIERIMKLNSVYVYELPSDLHSQSCFFSLSFDAWYFECIEKFYDEMFFFQPTPYAIGERELNICLGKKDFFQPIPERFDIINESAFDCAKILSNLIYCCFCEGTQITMIIPTKNEHSYCIEEISNSVSFFETEELRNNFINNPILAILTNFGFSSDHLDLLQQFFPNSKKNITIIISLMIIRKKTSIPLYFIQVLLIIFFCDIPENNRHIHWIVEWEKFFQSIPVIISKNALHYYNQFQIILSSLICLTRILRLDDWNPSESLIKLNGLTILKLSSFSEDSFLKVIVLEYFYRIENLAFLMAFLVGITPEI